MFLFRPWRRHVADARVWCNLHDSALDVDARYAAVWFEYERWIREDLEHTTAPYFTGKKTPKDWPQYATVAPEWWACMVLPRVRHFRFAMQRLQDIVPLTTVGNVPVDSDEEQSQDDNEKSDADVEAAEEGVEEHATGEGTEWDDALNHGTPARKAPKFLMPVAHLCTNVSAFRLGHAFFLNHPVFKTRSAEANFAQGFRDAVANTGLNTLPEDDTHVFCAPESLSAKWSPGESKMCSDTQFLYFKKLDTHAVDIASTGKREKTYTKQFEAQVHKVKRAFTTLALQTSSTEKSFTAVLEATFWLLRTGIVNVPGKSALNVKQARSLIHLAAWIQKKKTSEWMSEPTSSLQSSCKKTTSWHQQRGQDTFLQVFRSQGPCGHTPPPPPLDYSSEGNEPNLQAYGTWADALWAPCYL